MRYLLLCFLPTMVYGQLLQLAPPRFTSGDVFFKGKTTVAMEFALENATIHYSFMESPSVQAATYTLPLKINTSSTIKAISYHPDFLPSDVATRHYTAVKHRPDSMKLYKAAHKNYPGQGAASLFDLKKGGSNIHDGNWLGFSGDTVTTEAYFSDNISCKNLIISTLSDYNSWILPFKKVMIEGQIQGGSWVEIGFWTATDSSEQIAPKVDYANYVSIPLKRMNTRKLRITMEPFGNLPPGHPGAGSPAWLFLDEIVFQ